VTTDTDFEEFCTDESVTYVNPVPDAKRDCLSGVDG